MPETKPHRRLSLTQPTAPAPSETLPVEPLPKEVKETGDRQTVRVMAYLTEEEAETLDDLWVNYRRRPEKPSKSDILRAAFLLARNDPDALAAALSRLPDTTTTRQRDSKIV